jgi:molybdopterin molybdotransferase/putative molybdopterin biosynthesis protein
MSKPQFKVKGDKYMNMSTYFSREEALEAIFSRWQPQPGVETVSVLDCAGRVSAEDVLCKLTLPVARESMMDGIAVRSSDFAEGIPDTSRWKFGRDYAAADTGDDFDDRFDAVIRVENVEFLGDDDGVKLKIKEPVKAGDSVRPRGEYCEEGEKALDAGTLITAFQAAYLAWSGSTEVKVKRKPVIAYIASGDELIPIGAPVTRGKHIQTNGMMLATLIRNWGGECIQWPIIPDRKEDIARVLDEAAEKADIIITNGGTSMGSEDFCSMLLKEKCDYFHHGVRCVPGMPIGVGIMNKKPVISMPGPPVAAFCTSMWGLRALIRRWYGLANILPQTHKARLTEAQNKPAWLARCTRLYIEKDSGGAFKATPLNFDMRQPWVNSVTNGFTILPLGQEDFPEGSWIDFEFVTSEHL